ncbi:MAG: chemotaxis protein CheB [Ahniella sp.]|nr:chemotaxis protein CheB [Ahniella sp.]
MNEELPAAPVAAVPAMAPVAPAAVPPPIDDEDNPFADLGLSLDAINAAPPIPLQREAMAESSSEDDFMREFAALGALDQSPSAAIEHVVILGASIGGPDAVREFLSGVTGNKTTVFVLAQHMGADFVELMAQQLQRATRLNVLMPQAGQSAKAGDILIVPVAERMLLEPSGEIRLTVPDQASPYSPSIDQVLFDLADRFGDRAMAIIFSGMAHDAIEGAKYLSGRGGRIWVQDPTTCVVSSMIDGAMEAGVVSFIGSPTDLAQQFNREFK